MNITVVTPLDAPVGRFQASISCSGDKNLTIPSICEKWCRNMLAAWGMLANSDDDTWSFPCWSDSTRPGL